MFGNEQPAPCPAMEFEGNRFYCGAIRMLERAEEETISLKILKNMLGIGRGCDSQLESEVA